MWVWRREQQVGAAESGQGLDQENKAVLSPASTAVRKQIVFEGEPMMEKISMLGSWREEARAI